MRTRIRIRLAALVALALLPAIGLAIGLVAWNGKLQRERLEAGLSDTLAALTLAIEREIEAAVAAATALGTTPLIDSGDMDGLRRQAGALRAQYPHWRDVSVMDPGGQQLMSLLRPDDAPPCDLASLPVFQTAVQSGRPAVSDLMDSGSGDEKIVAINIPLYRQGRLAAVIGITLDPSGFADLLRLVDLAPGWSAGIVDSREIVVARVPEADGYVGTRAPGIRAAAANRASGSFTTGQGRMDDEALVAFRVSEATGWFVVIAAPQATIRDTLRQGYAAVALIGLPLFVFGIAAAFLYGRRLANALDSGTRTSDVLIAQLRDSEDRLRLLAGEMNHRTKNILQLVLVLVRKTYADGDPQTARAIEGRVAALARAHAALSESGSQTTNLRHILESELSPFRDAHGCDIAIDGPPVTIPPALAQPLVMAFHELATNAAKYGGLAPDCEGVNVVWTRDADGGLDIAWTERCPGPIAPPSRQGFGLSVVQQSLQPFGGTVEFDWRRHGLRCRLRLPGAAFREENE